MRKFLIFCFILLLVSFLAYSQNNKIAEAHISNHLVCTNIISETDAILANINTHPERDLGAVSKNDGYIYDNNIVPESDPQPGRFINERQLYNVLPTIPQSIYTARQTYSDGTATCNFAIQCPNQCTPPEITSGSGSCTTSCNLSLTDVSCPMYATTENWTLRTGGDDVYVTWGDGFATAYAGSPTTQTITHSYANAGKYDMTVECGARTCRKRVQVLCQTGGGAFLSPTPYPTSAPTPTGGAPLCATGLECMHPCSCDPSSNSYTSGSCGSGQSGAGGFGSSSGTGEGQACAPGLVCCAPPASSTSGWIKTKDASLHRIGALTNSIPSNASSYGAHDEVVCEPAIIGVSYRCLTSGITGLMTGTGTVSLGSGYTNTKLWARNTDTYTRSKEYSPDSLIQYMLAHNDVVYIDDLSDLQANKINYLNNTYSVTEIDNNGLSGKTPAVVLIENGDLRFDMESATFNPSMKGIVFIVDGEVEFKSTMTEANGIFIANSFDFAWDVAEGSTTTSPLLIRGNVISETATNCGAKRMRTDTTKPSCYFVMDIVNQYLTTMNMFSIQTYSRTTN